MKTGLFSINVDRGDKRLLLLSESLRHLGAEVFHVCDEKGFKNADLLLSIGGDGTFLRLLTAMKGIQTPVAGINFGHLGFLTTAKAGSSDGWVADLVAGNYSIDKRILVKACSDLIPEDFYPCGINEFAIHNKGASMLRIDVSLNGLRLPSYWADGIIVATPTGSTAYSLSVGGPIVFPDSNVLILTPVAPHNLNVRPLVVPAGSLIEIAYSSKGESALVTMDNRGFDAPSEGTFTITEASYHANIVRLHNMNFVDALRDKLLWGEDRRNTI